ncbi:polysaccharide pyruvyl transferase [Synechococcus sp. BIOS-E4-1]|uniref:polysaccharide pyruvyl transferase CsaB n=1 Tax=Synechococcus sp. BIOS-E4-1 TaxID=1400864 RepID=UPI00186252FC|nr:polysaccharide pyruvyl transferase CsaB [Synechococcus sp. BIOS-E4-1]QNI54787.1 polysaccharide pyruvyl transferase [Synechococcus sp. BIOS-E4-1]
MKALRSGRKLSVLLCGYYGEHNLGDDALLQVLVSQIPCDWDLVVTARDPDAVQDLVAGVSTVNRRSLSDTIQALNHVDALVLGGGSLLQDGTSFKSLLYYLVLLWSARFKRIPILLWGQGLGPLHHRFSQVLVKHTLSGVRAVSWRDPGSMGLAQRWGLNVPMVMGPDPVWRHPSPVWKGGDRLILCWRPTLLLDSRGWSVLLEAVDRLSSSGCSEVIWLAFHADQDASLWNELRSRDLIPDGLCRRSVQMQADSLEQVQTMFSEASLVIAMRLHALILAAMAGCPTAALSYDPKVKAAAQLAALPWVDLNNPLNADQLNHQWQSAVTAQRDGSQIQQLKRDAQLHQIMLVEELEKLSA